MLRHQINDLTMYLNLLPSVYNQSSQPECYELHHSTE